MPFDTRRFLAPVFPLSVLPLLLTLILAAILEIGLHAAPAAAQPAPPADAAQDTDAVMKPLLDVLKDDAARGKLIEALEGSTEASPADTSAETSLAGRLAAATKDTIDQSLTIGSKFASDMAGLASLFDSRTRFDAGLYDVLLPLFATVAASLFLRFLAGRGFRGAISGLVRRLAGRGFFATIALVAMCFLGEALALAIAYFGAGAVSASLFGPPGVTIYQTLYLNAFLIAGAASIVIRLLTGIVDDDYAVLRFSPAVLDQIRWRGIVLSGILVYGIAFLVPAFNNLVSYAVGRGLRVLVYTLAALFAVWMIRAVSAVQKAEFGRPPPGKDEADEAIDEALPEPVHSALLQVWPLIGYIYVAASYLIALSRPDLFVEFVGGATLKTAIALIAGGLVLRFFGYLSTKTVRAPEYLPLDSRALSARLAAMVPYFLRALWLIVSVVVLAAIIDAWAIFDVTGWIAGERGGAIVAGLVSSLLVILASAIVWAAASSWIDHRMDGGRRALGLDARHRTLYSLLKNALAVALIVFGGMIALSELGVDIGPLLAGAGVLGLAIGFGSQKLVQDIISGIFIQLENAMNVGDVVSAGGSTGVVERLTLRSVALRDLSGVYHIIPFSSVDSVSNFMRLFSYHVEEVGIAYKESVADGKAAMQEAFDRLMQTEHKADILEPLEMHGVIGLGDSAVMLRARIKTAPGKQFALGRAYTELVKQVMDERNIEIPFPHTTLVLGRDKQGRPDEIAVDIKPAAKGQAGSGEES